MFIAIIYVSGWRKFTVCAADVRIEMYSNHTGDVRGSGNNDYNTSSSLLPIFPQMRSLRWLSVLLNLFLVPSLLVNNEKINEVWRNTINMQACSTDQLSESG